MMLNSYVPNAYKRYAIAGLAIALVAPLAASAYEMIFGAGLAHGAYEFLASPFGLAAIAASLGITVLIAGLGYRHDRLVRRIRSERAATEQLRQAAYHDSLTGLRNRHALNEDVQRIVRSKTGNAAPTALLLFDLDRFKSINDTMGHVAGDTVLKTLADRLLSYARPGQQVYRLGGDEFVLLWESAPGTETISNFCEGLAAFVFRPVESPLGAIDTAGSIGISVSDPSVVTLSELLKRADLALYHAKERPGSSHSFFTHDMDSEQQQRLRREAEMRAGTDRGEFHLDYRPVLRAGTLSISGFTVELRWTHPEEGNLVQSQFMATAESSGLILPLGKWMLERALADASGWPEKADITLPVYALQLRDPGFAAWVIAAIEAAGFDAGRLVLVVQSNATVTDGAIVLGNLERLREKGVKISVSELAASIAGLSMTRAFPVDRVHLDLASIRKIAGEGRLVQMLTLLLQLASTVETPVTLSGVDSLEDLKCACDAGAEHVQGKFAGPRFCALQAARFPMATEDPAPIARSALELLRTA